MPVMNTCVPPTLLILLLSLFDYYGTMPLLAYVARGKREASIPHDKLNLTKG